MAKQINLKLLKEAIADRNLSYHMVSRRTGISVSLLSLMFNGKRNMTVAKLNMILEATGVNISNICD